MSRDRKPLAVLLGYSGPFYPDSVDDFAVALGPGAGRAWIGLVASRVAGFTRNQASPFTEDEYKWYCALTFNRGEGQVVVLIPWSLDIARRGGSKADRAIAAYTLGLDESEAAQVVQELSAAAQRQREDELQADAAGFDYYRADNHLRAGPRMLRRLLAAHVDGRPKSTANSHVTGRHLAIHLRERLEWPTGSNMPVDFSLVVYKTPVAQYVSLSDTVAQLGDQSATLGSSATFCKAGGRYVEVELEPDNFYDVMVLGRYADGSTRIVGWVRYSTADADHELPTEITLDEAKLAATLAIGLDRQAGTFFTADLVHMSDWGEGTYYQIVGFDFGRPREGSDKHYGVLVNQYGYAQIYCDRTPREMWHHLNP